LIVYLLLLVAACHLQVATAYLQQVAVLL